MGERKVLNKYFPPDWDPSRIPRGKKPKNQTVEVRMMLPFSMCCQTCGEFMYRGKKFNSRKEDVQGDDYLGIRKLRFYIKCVNCNAEITFKTDPKNSDYECETGAKRLTELWQDKKNEDDAAIEQVHKDQEQGDAMTALENRTIESKMEMDTLDMLDEIKALNRRNNDASIDDVLKHIRAADTQAGNGGEPSDAEAARRDDELVRRTKFASSSKIHRVVSDDEDGAVGGVATRGDPSGSTGIQSLVNQSIANEMKRKDTMGEQLSSLVVKKRQGKGGG